MSEEYKKYTVQARRGIKGEAFFEALISDYSIPHQIVGSKDIGIDYICEWVYGDKPTGVLYAVQVKTFSEQTAKPKFIEIDTNLNGLKKYEIPNSDLIIDDKTLHYWQGLGIPVYLFAIVQTANESDEQRLDCYYKRFTPVLTTSKKQEELVFYKVSDGTSFIAFLNQGEKRLGFARDLFIDYIRWSYYKGSITYLPPETIGLNQFPEGNAVFIDLLKEYKDKVCLTYAKTKNILEKYCFPEEEVYNIEASGYFRRAVRNLNIARNERKEDYLFYSALEFRNCVERILFEYLYLTGHKEWSLKWEKLYRPTQLKDEILKIEPEFFKKLEFANLLMKAGNLTAIHILDLDALSQVYGRLGNYLHASKRPDETSDSPQWWDSFYNFLNETSQTLLQVFTRPMGFMNFNERGWQLYSKWKEGSLTNEQVLEELKRGLYEQPGDPS